MARAAAVLLTTLLALGPGGACAAATEDGSDQRLCGWQFEATPYFWLPETHGTISVRDLSADVDIGLDDVFDLLGDGDLFGGMGHFEARNDKLALFVDAMGAVVDAEADGKILHDRVGVDVNLDFDMVTVELGAAYRALERGRLTLEGLAGGRYTYVHSGIEANVADRRRSEDGSADFLDPFLGGRGAIRLAEQWSLVCRGDVGGFGLGSELAWTIIGGIRWNTPWNPGAARTSLFAGYKVYDLDYETGRGNRKREFDLQMRGLALGMTFTF